MKRARARTVGSTIGVGLSLAATVACARASVSTTLVGDIYLVRDGGRTYSVVDVYVRGNHLGDSIGGLTGTSSHPLVIATNRAQGVGVVRDADGRLVAGTITSDLFVQAGGSSWRPDHLGSEAWDSFVTCGARVQGSCVTNRAGSVKCTQPVPTASFSQFAVPNANYIDNGGASGWLDSHGANPYLTSTGPSAAENPFARISLYNSSWSSTYPDLQRSGVLVAKGSLVNGALTAWGAPEPGTPGTSLDFHWMLGRFAIDVTELSGGPVTLNVQFRMTCKNGSSNEIGLSPNCGIAGCVSYHISQFFLMANSAPACPVDLDGNRIIDGADIALLLLDFGSCAGCPADLDGNSSVDTADLSLLLLEFGDCPPCVCP